MQSEFKSYIIDNKLFDEDDKLVIALSGGVDSIVLTDLLSRLGNDCVVAHCNFHLRGEDSNLDEQFVCDFAKSRGLACRVNHFQTEEYAIRHGISIEMAARDLRYAWFEELRKELGFDKIALAHHSDDQIETFFINLLRGSGINGLKGMRPANGVLVRPLLWASRAQIQSYALENALSWREDKTNAESLFLRNKIRNDLMPVFDAINVESRKSILRSINHLAAENELYRLLLSDYLDGMIESHDGVVRVAKSVFDGKNGFQLLFEWLRNYGFNSDQCGFILQNIDGVSGRSYFSNGYALVVERGFLELYASQSVDDREFVIEKGCFEIDAPLKMTFFDYLKQNPFTINTLNSVVQFDFDKLTFPLKLRHWRKGDRFFPLGMKGSKLLSDYFVDQSFTNQQKHAAWLLLTAKDEIIWIVGSRIDDRFKITKATSYILECSLK